MKRNKQIIMPAGLSADLLTTATNKIAPEIPAASTVSVSTTDGGSKAVVGGSSIPRSTAFEYSSTRDLVYSHEIARRATAVACLNLGIAECTVEVLDVLSNSLIDFLEKVGNTISFNVELSGRPSSHVNILDALDAVDLVMQSHSTTSFVTPMSTTADATDGITAPKEQLGDNNCNTTSRIDFNSGSTIGGSTGKFISPWESLAEFAFGPNWFIEGKKREEYNQKSLSSANKSTLNPFKHSLDIPPPDMAAVTQTATGNETAEKSDESYREMLGGEFPKQQCWYAPYVDVVPFYPIMQKIRRVGSTPLNLRNELHQQQQQQQQQHLDASLSSRENMEEQAKMAEARIDGALRSIPDTKYWGVPPSVFESNMNGEKEHHDVIKMGDEVTPSEGADTTQKDSHHSTKIYPFFLPPLPPAYTYKFSSSASSLEGTQLAEAKISYKLTDPSQGGTTCTTTTSSSNLFHDEELLKDSTVRSSLVKFSDDGDLSNDNDYWGRRKRRKVMDDRRPLVVPKGLTTTGSGTSTSATNTGQQLTTIRPSTNRANRILEGSMDTS